MKNVSKFAFIISTIVVLVILCSFSVSAAEFDIDKDGTLVKYNGKGGDVIIPEGVKKIYDYAFWNASYDPDNNTTHYSLKVDIVNITFPKSFRFDPDLLDKVACNSNFRNIFITNGNPYYHVEYAEDYTAIYDSDITELLFLKAKEEKEYYIKNYTIPDTVTVMCSGSVGKFDYDMRIQNLTVHGCVRIIDSHCLYICDNLFTQKYSAAYMQAVDIKESRNEDKSEDNLTINATDGTAFIINNVSASPDASIGFAPSYTNRLSVNISLQINMPEFYTPVNIIMTVFTEQNKPVCSYKNTVYRSGPVIFEWNGMAGKNNSAGIPITDYVPAGKYHIKISASANVLNENITENAQCDVLVLNKTKAATYGTDYKNMSPIYTGDYNVDYMTKTILDSIIDLKMTNYQKIEAVYLWILKNCAHDETKCIHCVNGWNFFDKNKIETEGKKLYKEYYIKFLKGEADILLGSISSNDYPYLFHAEENSESLYRSLKIDSLLSYNLFNNMKAELILEHRTAICSYFAALFRAMVNQLGFKSEVVIGKYQNNNGKQYEHYWNYVVINGNYYWIDTDIDCILYRNSGKLSYQNFLKKDSDKSWTAHHIWDPNAYPACK